MKVRIGFGLGIAGLRDEARFGELVDALEGNGLDSLWLSERVAGEALDPVIGLSFAAGRTTRLKLGTSVQVLPGRNPALVAKEWASLDRLSVGRALPAFGLGNPIAAEHQAFGVAREDRASIFDEALPLIRRLWAEDEVHHDGKWFQYDALTVHPKPMQGSIDVWLGGRAPSELRRCGRLGDGWLASFFTPADCAEGRPVIEEAAAAEDRAIDPEHFGAMVTYSHEDIPDALRERLAAIRPGLDASDLVPVGLDALRTRLTEYVDVGFSKLVLVPLAEPKSWDEELARVADAVLDLQT
ncbi:MAG: LLM class flavin-dependent oxidoreductase [Actinobacteria bacterium]|nr:LLM class flavin-dependent oxidoreductase [Actinomycetota bacterium]